MEQSFKAQKDLFYNPNLYDLKEEYEKYNQILLKGEKNKKALFRLGRINHFWGKLEEAEKYYKKALEIDPDDGEIHYNLGNLYFKDGKFGKAKKELTIAVELKPTDIYGLNALGKTCFKLKELEESRKYHKQALENNPQDVYAMRGIGDICLVEKNYKEALNYYNKALIINSEDNLTLHNIGLVHLLSGNTEQSEEHYKKCLEKDKNFPGFYFGLGLCYYKQNKKLDAFENYKTGSKLGQGITDYLSLGEIYEEISDLGLAFKGKIENLEGNTLMAESHYCKGNAYYSLGQISKAIEELKKSIETDESFISSYIMLGKLYSEDGNRKEAIKYYEMVLKIDPDCLEVEEELCKLKLKENPENIKSLERLKYIYWLRENLKEEIEILEKIVEICPEADNFYSLGYALLANGQKDRAEKAFNKIIETGKNEDLAASGMTLLYSTKKDYLRALHKCEKALRVEENCENYIHFGNIYRNLGDTGKALESYARAFKLEPFSRTSYRHYIDCLVEKNDYEIAGEIISSHSQMKDYNLLKAEFYIRFGEYRKAEQYLLEMEKNTGPMEYIHLCLGICYQEDGFYEMALEELKNSLKKNEFKGESYGRMLLIYAKMGDNFRVKEMANKARNFIKTIEPMVRYEITLVLFEMNLKEEFDDFFNKTLRSLNTDICFVSKEKKEKAITTLKEIEKKLSKQPLKEEVIHKITPSINSEEEGKKKSEEESTPVDPVCFEIGRSLIPLIDPNQGAKLMERITSIRRHIYNELGIIFPGIRFKDSLEIEPNGYIIKIKDREVGKGQVFLNKHLVIGPEETMKGLKGYKCFEPVYSMPALWIEQEELKKAENKGYMIFDPLSIITTHITEVIKEHCVEFIGRREVSFYLETVEKTHPVLVKEIYPLLFTLGEIKMVLKNLLGEKISIRDLPTILETMGDYASETKDIDKLTDYVRNSLSGTITKIYRNYEGNIEVFTLDENLEIIIKDCIKEQNNISFGTESEELLIEALKKQVDSFLEKGKKPILYCPGEIKNHLKHFIGKRITGLALISRSDLIPEAKIKIIGTCSIKSRKFLREKNLIAKRDIFSYIEKLINDSSPLLRCEGFVILKTLIQKGNLNKIFDYIDKGMNDKDHNVRLEAAKVLREVVNSK